MSLLSPPASAGGLKQQVRLHLLVREVVLQSIQEKLVVEFDNFIQLEFIANDSWGLAGLAERCLRTRPGTIQLREYSVYVVATFAFTIEDILDELWKALERRSREDEINTLEVLDELLAHRRFTVGSPNNNYRIGIGRLQPPGHRDRRDSLGEH